MKNEYFSDKLLAIALLKLFLLQIKSIISSQILSNLKLIV